jgi:YVTN family beta-propeller protein
MKYLHVFTNPPLPRSVIWQRPALFLVVVMLLASFQVGTALGSDPTTPLAYVTQRDARPDEPDLCSVSGSISAIDTTSNQVVATVEVGPGPHGMVISPTGKKAYVANYGTFPTPLGQARCLSDTVSVLRLGTRHLAAASGDKTADAPKVVATVTVGPGPLAVAITPDDEEVYVTNFGRDPSLFPGGVPGNTVSVIQTRSNEVVATIPVGKLPAGVAITPDGKHAYVTNRGDNEVSVIDTATHTVVATVPVQIQPANIAFTPDGRRAYVTNFGSNTVSVIDTATHTVVPVPDGEAIKVGIVPIGVAITPDGGRVYVVNVNFSPFPPFPPGEVSVIDTATNTVVKTVAVGAGPRAVAITPDGAHAYVTNFLDLLTVDGIPVDGSVSVIELATNTVVDTVPLAGGPNWVTIADRHEKVQKKHH